jgi:hypothetical protein
MHTVKEKSINRRKLIKIKILITVLKILIKTALDNGIKLYITPYLSTVQTNHTFAYNDICRTNHLQNSKKQNAVKHIAFT